MAVIESALVNVVSAAGARGVWQFMPETAKERGMEVNEKVDERYHLEKSTEAACQYFLTAKKNLVLDFSCSILQWRNDWREQTN